jgi:short-subunit dehydrogenase
MAEGVRVWGTARSHERMVDLAAKGSFTPLLLDLAVPESVDAAYAEVARQAGGNIALVVNNAGYGVFGPFAAETFAVWRRQLEAALLGNVQITHAALRDMVQANSGCIVNVSSVAVEYPLPYMAGYNMAKAALSALSESLIFETRGTGVSVIDFRPGDYRTAFNQSMQSTSAVLSSPQDPRVARSWAILERNLAAGAAPERAARDLKNALLSGRSGTVYSGNFFQTKLAPLFSRLAPSRLRRAVAARYFGAV